MAKLIKGCLSRIKGRCVKSGMYCSFNPNSVLKTCPNANAKEEKKGKEKK
jgi:hypothetical protein